MKWLGLGVVLLGLNSLSFADDVEEFTVQASGIQDYHQYADFTDELRGFLPKGITFVKRQVSRGEVIFVFKTSTPLEEIKTAFSQVTRAKVGEWDDYSVKVEMK